MKGGGVPAKNSTGEDFSIPRETNWEQEKKFHHANNEFKFVQEWGGGKWETRKKRSAQKSRKKGCRLGVTTKKETRVHAKLVGGQKTHDPRLKV